MDLFGSVDSLIGVVVGDQQASNARGMELMRLPAAQRCMFVTASKPINLRRWLYPAKPMNCPRCGGAHVDTQWHAHRPHDLHTCRHCGEKFEGDLAYGAKEERPALDLVICAPGAGKAVFDDLRQQCGAAGIPLFVKHEGDSP